MRKLILTPPPHKMQRKVMACPTRFTVSAWGRQSGKSTFGNKKLVINGWQKRNGVYWFVAPTYAQAEVHWRRVRNSMDPRCFLERNKTHKYFRFLSGSYLFYKSGDNFDNLRTETLDGVVIDEVREQSKDLWPLVIYPMLGTTGGWADFISTPNGFDHFFDVSERAKNDAETDWSFFNAPSTCNPVFTQEEFEVARNEMSEAQFAQEIMAEFRDLTAGRAYICFGDHNRVTANPWSNVLPFSPYLPIVVACDFNLSPMSWTIGQTKGGDWCWFDEIYLHQSHTAEAANELVARIKHYRAMGHKAKPSLIITGDATSHAGQRAAEGRSDYDILTTVLRDNDISFQLKVPAANPGVKDRVNTMNSKFRSADGTVHCWILEPGSFPGFGCPMLIRDCQRVVWKTGARARPLLDQVKDPDLTHASDGPGYAQCELTPIKGVRQPGGISIIRR